jgi:hypothetical protein
VAAVVIVDVSPAGEGVAAFGFALVGLDIGPFVEQGTVESFDLAVGLQTLVSRRCRFLTICGSNVPSRSRGISMSTSPTASEMPVFDRVPLRTFVDSSPARHDASRAIYARR